MLSKLLAPYGGVREILFKYWAAYGGLGAILCSPYMHAAFIATLLSPAYWLDNWQSVATPVLAPGWATTSISVLPNLIGFALGGYAIWLGFGDDQFRALISQRRKTSKASPYLEVSATFAHFILVQLIALMAGIIGLATNRTPSEIWASRVLLDWGVPAEFFYKWLAPVGHALGFFLLVYALTAAVAATLAVFRVATWFDTYRNMPARPLRWRDRMKSRRH